MKIDSEIGEEWWQEPEIGHKHQCPDCGVIHTCPCGKSCGIEYAKYPCHNCMKYHMIFFSDTIEGAYELHKQGL